MTQKIKKYVCIHGHFYQPPRENPWLEFLEEQYSAYPSHDWNERVFLECYASNSAARIDDPEGRIVKIFNNYEYMSHNFGPTLLSWMQNYNENIYNRIIDADKNSRKKYNGHGNAIAQVYNHIIMPLASYEEKLVQIIWGIKDFEMRYNRKPDGMWLAETAVDLETLTIMQENGIKFTILSPFQASKFRKTATDDWVNAQNGTIDSRRPYLINLPNGKNITAFFYNAQLANAIAFGGILKNSEDFIASIFSNFSEHGDEVQLVHVATDGESYGHHKKFGDMTLAYALYTLSKNEDVKIINYGAFLEKYPPKYEAQIFENSAWSCVHGVQRCASNCGCNTNSQPGWNQEWRAPLREALNYIRDIGQELYHRKMGEMTHDYLEVFYDYYEIIHRPSLLDEKNSFIEKHIKKKLNEHEIKDFFQLLELKRNANLMFTSCGWFFAELSGIETVQILEYAARVIQILQDFDHNIEHEFLNILKKANSNIKEYNNGEEIYLKLIKPKILYLKKIAIHFAVTSLFEEYADINKLYIYEIECLDFNKEIRGTNKLVFGHIVVKSERTTESQQFQFAVLYYGDTDIHCAIEGFENKGAYLQKKEKIINVFKEDHLTELVQQLTFEFGTEYFTLHDVFLKERSEILEYIMKGEMERYQNLMFYLAQKTKKIVEYCYKEKMLIPQPLIMFNEYTYQKIIGHLFSNELSPSDLYQQVKQVITIVNALNIKLRLEDQVDQIQVYIEEASEKYLNNLSSVPLLKDFVTILRTVSLIPGSVSLWNLENKWFEFFTEKEAKLIEKQQISNAKIIELLAEVKKLLKIKV